MGATTPSTRSYDALARAAVAHPDWPATAKLQPRSLAALLGKLDRGQELEWLADRLEVQQVLADVLAVPAVTVARAVGGDLERSDRAADRVRLDDVPYARPLLLAEERLPPGIPAEAMNPNVWRRSLWRAPSGAGRTLVGKWLEARRLAAFIQAGTWSEAARRLGGPGPVFVELHSVTAAHELLQAEPRSPICVAAPLEPDAAALTSAGWKLIESPPPESFADHLAAWVAERLPGDSDFDQKKAAEWLHAAIEAGMASTLGALLGLAGVFDELGTRTLERTSRSKLAEVFVTRRMAKSARNESADANWLRKEGWDLLRGLGRRLLTDSEDPWAEARTLDEWVRLVPLEYQRSVDADWVRLSLSRAASPVTVRELERALKELPPGGFRVVRSLRNANLLREDATGGRYTLGPTWFSEALRSQAVAELGRASPVEWGEALVRSHAVADIVTSVQSSPERDEWIDEVMELEASENPAQVAALELIFRLTGLAALTGQEGASEGLAGLWDAQLDLALELGDLPHPRFPYPGAIAERTPELLTGTWYLASLAISEQLETHEGRRHLLLRPWLLGRPAPGFERVLDVIAEVVLAYPDVPWAVESFALIARLRDAVGESLISTGVHLLEAADVLVSAWKAGTLSRRELEAVSPFSVLLGAVRRLAEDRSADWPQLAQALWRLWDEAGMPDWRWLEGANAEALWSHVPLDVLDRVLGAEAPPSIAYAAFDAARWDLVLDHRKRRADPPGFWSALPSERWARALRERLPKAAMLGELWTRNEGAVHAEFLARLEDDPESAIALARAAPDPIASDLVEAVGDRVRSGRFQSQSAIAWLVDRVRIRKADWQSAFRLIAELEKKAGSQVA